MNIQAISMAFGGLKTATDIIKNITQISKDTEINSRVIELQNIILDLQSNLLSIQQEFSELSNEKQKLEEALCQKEEWNNIAKRYRLTEISKNVFAYVLVDGFKSEGPIHYLCTNCFDKKQKSILQCFGRDDQYYNCPNCSAKIKVAEKTM